MTSRPETIDHTSNDALVIAAGEWLATQAPEPSPVIATLRKTFGLTIRQAIEAAKIAQVIRYGRAS